MSRVSIALVCNPGAGARLQASSIREALERHGAGVEAFELDAVAAAVRSGADRVAVAGGDGSIAPVAAAAGAAGVSLAVIPTGTANDFARALDLPRDLDGACELAAGGQRRRRLDLGRAGERPFVNVANAGLAVRAAQEATGLKRALGPLAYGIGALRAGVAAEPLRCEVRCDDRLLFEGRAWQLIIANTGAFGAGSQIGLADPEDGRTDVLVIPAGSRLALARRAAGLRSGRIAEQPTVRHGAGARVDVDVASGTAFNVDGEVCPLGATRFSVEPQAFELIVS